MPDLLLELFSEEIPARMQAEASAHLQAALIAGLQKQQFAISADQAKAFVTPRRIAVIVTGLAPAQSSSTTEEKGPKTGAPEAALQGFMKKHGITQKDLIERDGTYFATIHREGKQTADALTDIIEKTLTSFPWPKSMRWGDGDAIWVRPLHGIVCVFDGAIVPIHFGAVRSGDTTSGHRFLSSAPINVTPADYEAQLEKAHVIADRDKRKAAILTQAEKAAAAHSLTIKKDDALFDEVTGLVEWPVLLAGRIDAEFIDLPPELLTTVMRSHQKYFSLLDGTGALAPHFLIASNMTAADGGKAIIAGNERVLRARFADARFFWDQDRKKPLDEWAEGLASVTFHAKLGTVADKVARIETLALVILSTAKDLAAAMAKDPSASPQDDIKRAARLCKADLVTGMVGEFAELQGIMGRYYAQSEAPEVADAIRDHYKPQGPNDSVPNQPVSICIALADKLDSLASMFAIGEKPTGSKDPFALRRAALGIIRVILENELKLPLNEPIRLALKQVRPLMPLKDGAPDSTGTRHEILDFLTEILNFFTDRLKVQLKDQGIRHDVISAVTADGDDDLLRVVARARALQDFLTSEDGANLLIAYRRAANILAIEEKKDGTHYKAYDITETFDNPLMQQEEINLRIFLAGTNDQIAQYLNQEKFHEMMALLAQARNPIDQFFEKIMVNCQDKDLRKHRLRLLASIRQSMDNVADFSKIEG